MHKEKTFACTAQNDEIWQLFTRTNFPPEQVVNQLWISSFPWWPKQRDSYLAGGCRMVEVGYMKSDPPRSLQAKPMRPRGLSGVTRTMMCTTVGRLCCTYTRRRRRRRRRRRNTEWETLRVLQESTPRWAHTEICTQLAAPPPEILFYLFSFSSDEHFWRWPGQRVQGAYVCFPSLLIGLRC